ncbi:hypothetical protein BABA_04454 [Neobacillus bataviensis LMG 21833]|uniref:Uncharacterized protein n=1 Tax=Neobacillus bataviensis LMG 21833 TaxID=1117379 RepID=K6DQP0_9BACI|nr:hypothetical protein [Neobacillus bataviensis]EKN70664.1 hypothetical protein BABA_04454 [Neobacillus bataviensis LMG 21833]
MKDRVERNQSYINSQKVGVVQYTNTRKLVLGSVLAAIAALFQSAGVFVGIGYAFSILATLPIVLSAMISLRIGIMSYIITILLLTILQPSELFVFPFTTGLLGITLGAAFKWWNNWMMVSLAGGIGLTLGIMILLYGLQFPVLGPSVSHTFDFKIGALILLFSLFYSSIWTGLSKKVYKLLFREKVISNC